MKLEKKAKKKHTRNYVAGLFDVDERHAKLTLLGDPLVELKKMIDWEAFRSEIEAAREKARGRSSKRLYGIRCTHLPRRLMSLRHSTCRG